MRILGIFVTLVLVASGFTSQIAYAADSSNPDPTKSPEIPTTKLEETPPVTQTVLTTNQTPEAQSTISIKATTDADVSETHDSIQIINADTKEAVKTCDTGTECVYDYPTEAWGADKTFYAKTLNTTSNSVQALNTAPSLTLVSDREQASEKESYIISLKDAPTPPSGKWYHIADDKTGTIVASCSNPATLCSTSSIMDETDERRYKAYLADNGFPSTVANLKNIISDSNSVIVSRTPWSINLSSDNPFINDGDVFWLRSKPNQDLPSNLKIYFWNKTKNKFLLASVTSSTGEGLCTGTKAYRDCSTWLDYSTNEEYVAYIAKNSTTLTGTSTLQDLEDIKAVSNTLNVKHLPWNLKLTYNSANKSFTGYVNQPPTQYAQAIIEVGTNRIVQLCWRSVECKSKFAQFGFEGYPNSSFPLPLGADYVIGRYNGTANGNASEADGYMYDIQAWTHWNAPSTAADTPAGISLPSSTTGGSNPSQPCPQTCVADPINTVTGEFWLDKKDLTIQSSTPITFNRYYGVSKRTIKSSLGYGWTNNYDMKISPIDSASLTTATQVQIAQENGSLIYFTKNSAGEWTTDLKTRATLTRQPDSWTLTRNKETIFTFDNNGMLSNAKDRNNNSVNLNYTNGKLTTISNNKNQTLTLTWGTNGLIKDVTSPTGKKTQYDYINDELQKVTFPDGTTNEYTYDSTHALLTQKDANSNVTTNVYDDSKRVIKQTAPLSTVTTITYSNLKTTVTQPNNRVDEYQFNNSGQVIASIKNTTSSPQYQEYYEYDAAGNLTSTTYPDGATIQKNYDADGNPLQIKDRAGNITSYTYNSFKEPLTETNPAGKTKTYGYDAAGNLTSSTDFNGNSASFIVNPDGTVQKAIDADQSETTFQYNGNGLLTQITNPLGKTVSQTYNTDGWLLTISDAVGNTIEMTYDSMGRLLEKKYPNNHSDIKTYDNNGNLITTTNRLNKTTTYTYNALNMVTRVSDPKGNETKTEYDTMGNVTKTIDALLKETVYTYNLLGQLVTKKNANSNTEKYYYTKMGQINQITNYRSKNTYYNYDANGNLIEAIDPTNIKTSATYNSLGLITTTTDTQRKVTSYGYDDNGNLVTLTRPDGGIETNSYNPTGQITSHTDTAAGVKQWTYDLNKQLTSFTNTDNTVTNYTYDDAGNTTSETRPDNSVVSYEYTYNQLTKEIYSDATNEFSYNDAGMLAQEKRGTNITNYTYDDNGNVTTRGPPSSAGVSYTYTKRNEIASVTYPSGHAINYTYDNIGLLTTADSPQVGTFSYGYDAQNNVTSITSGNGVTQANTYNDADQLTQDKISNGSTLFQKNYTYSTLSGLLAKTDTTYYKPSTVNTVENYAYDSLARLTSTKNASGTSTSTYDYSPTGNLTNFLGATQTFNTSNQLTASGTKTYTFDGRGNRTTQTDAATGTVQQTNTYNQADKLTKVEAGSKQVEYSYDINGLLQTRKENGDTKNFTWDYQNNVPLLLDDGDYEYFYGASNTPIAQLNKNDGTKTYLNSDALGSVVTATKNDKSQAAFYNYKEYGQLPSANTNDSNHTVTRFGFAGEWIDPTTNLYNLRARWYDPGTGSFLSRDPLEQSTNAAYSYAAGNPLLKTDPLGLFTWGEMWQNVDNFLADDTNRGNVNLAIQATAVVAITACTLITLGICGGVVGATIVIASIGIASGVADYGLTEACQTTVGYLQAAILGAVGGGKGTLAKEAAKETVEFAAKDVGKSIVDTATRKSGDPVEVGMVGRYEDLAGPKYDDLEAHHMPSSRHLQANMGYSKDEAKKGLAIVMTKSDHMKTRTYAGRNISLIKNEADLDPNIVLERDIQDYLNITGDTEGIAKLRELYKTIPWYTGP